MTNRKSTTLHYSELRQFHLHNGISVLKSKKTTFINPDMLFKMKIFIVRLAFKDEEILVARLVFRTKKTFMTTPLVLIRRKQPSYNEYSFLVSGQCGERRESTSFSSFLCCV